MEETLGPEVSPTLRAVFSWRLPAGMLGDPGGLLARQPARNAADVTNREPAACWDGAT